MGFNFYADLHIVVKGELSVREGHRIAHRVENEVLTALPEVSEVLVHVEPQEELLGSKSPQIIADRVCSGRTQLCKSGLLGVACALGGTSQKARFCSRIKRSDPD